MNTYFVVLMNKAGAVCASNACNTIYEYAEGIPVAFACNPSSVFPWRECLSQMKKEQKPVQHQIISDYINDIDYYIDDLEKIINDRMSIDSWKDWLESSEEEDRTVFVVGFGQNDIFPSCIKAVLTYDEDLNAFSLSRDKTTISHENRADISWLGNFNIIEPVIYGIREKSAAELEQLISSENENILNNLDVNSEVLNSLHDDIDAAFYESASVAEKKQFEILKTGIGTFSIENMVSSAEMIINTNTMLSNLSMKDKDYLKEIIVIQIPEGVTWCLKD